MGRGPEHFLQYGVDQIPGLNPIPEANVVHIGARDLDLEEERLLQQSEIEVVTPGEGGSNVRKAAGIRIVKAFAA